MRSGLLRTRDLRLCVKGHAHEWYTGYAWVAPLGGVSQDDDELRVRANHPHSIRSQGTQNIPRTRLHNHPSCQGLQLVSWVDWFALAQTQFLSHCGALDIDFGCCVMDRRKSSCGTSLHEFLASCTRSSMKATTLIRTSFWCARPFPWSQPSDVGHCTWNVNRALL